MIYTPRDLLHAASVYQAEAEKRRLSHPSMADRLLQWAANARRDADEYQPEPPDQPDLFARPA